MAGEQVTFTTTVNQYARDHHMTEEQAIKALGLQNNVNRYQIFTFEKIPEGGYKTVTSKMDTFQSSTQRTQDLETPPSTNPETQNTKYMNDKRKEFQNSGFWGKIGVGAEVFFTHPTDFLTLFE